MQRMNSNVCKMQSHHLSLFLYPQIYRLYDLFLLFLLLPLPCRVIQTNLHKLCKNSQVQRYHIHQTIEFNRYMGPNLQESNNQHPLHLPIHSPLEPFHLKFVVYDHHTIFSHEDLIKSYKPHSLPRIPLLYLILDSCQDEVSMQPSYKPSLFLFSQLSL